MSKFKLTLALLGVVLFIGLGVSVVSPPTCTAGITKYGVPGDTFNLAGPTAPSGVTYTYLWTVTASSGNQVLTSANQNTQYLIPTASPASYYIVLLSVGSGTSTSGQVTGCVLQNCLNISVQLTNTCVITGEKAPCQTNTSVRYSYTGNAIIAGEHPTAYLNWIVDTTSVATHDNTGSYTVNWTNFWTPGGLIAQTHNVIVEVRSIKSNALLSTCTYPVTVLPTPVTTITST
jgi:hypothetical protein